MLQKRIKKEIDIIRISKWPKAPSYTEKERRRFPRFNRKLRIKYEYGDEYNINSSVNVSRCGALIKSKSPLPVNSHIVIRMELPTSHEEVIIVSRVVRVKRGGFRNVYFIALDFSSMDITDSKRLSEFFETLL